MHHFGITEIISLTALLYILDIYCRKDSNVKAKSKSRSLVLARIYSRDHHETLKIALIGSSDCTSGLTIYVLFHLPDAISDLVVASVLAQ